MQYLPGVVMIHLIEVLVEIDKFFARTKNIFITQHLVVNQDRVLKKLKRIR
jgi:hypothetical protein